MSKLRLLPPTQISTNPQVNRDAQSWAQQNNDQLERLLNGQLDSSNIKAGTLEITDLSSAAINNLLPWHIDIDVFLNPITNTNWSTPTLDANSIHGGYMASSGAQNDLIGWDVVLAAGTWIFELEHDTASTRGIYSIRLDGVEVGTIDGYSAILIWNVRTLVAGIVVATTGKKRLTLQMATKNGSSSSYIGAIQHVQLRRTA